MSRVCRRKGCNELVKCQDDCRSILCTEHSCHYPSGCCLGVPKTKNDKFCPSCANNKSLCKKCFSFYEQCVCIDKEKPKVPKVSKNTRKVICQVCGVLEQDGYVKIPCYCC